MIAVTNPQEFEEIDMKQRLAASNPQLYFKEYSKYIKICVTIMNFLVLRLIYTLTH